MKRLSLIITFGLLGLTTLANAATSTLSRSQVHRELDAHRIQLVETKDNVYIIPSHDWLVGEFLPYYRAFLWQSFADYTPEGLDCDNFCVFFQSSLFVANIQGGGTRRGEVPAGVLWSQPRNSPVPHVQILIRTDRGWNVVEPQNGSMTSLASYARSNTITKVIF